MPCVVRDPCKQRVYPGSRYDPGGVTTLPDRVKKVDKPKWGMAQPHPELRGLMKLLLELGPVPSPLVVMFILPKDLSKFSAVFADCLAKSVQKICLVRFGQFSGDL